MPPLVPVIPLPPVVMLPVLPVLPVACRKNISGETVPTVQFVTTTPELYKSEKYAEFAATSPVKDAASVTNGEAHDVPIVPFVALTVTVPDVTVSPLAVTTELALFAARLYVLPATLSYVGLLPHPLQGPSVTVPLALSLIYTVCPEPGASNVRCDAFTLTSPAPLADVPTEPLSLTRTTLYAVPLLDPVMPVPLVVIFPPVPVSCRKKILPDDVPA